MTIDLNNHAAKTPTFDGSPNIVIDGELILTARDGQLWRVTSRTGLMRPFQVQRTDKPAKAARKRR